LRSTSVGRNYFFSRPVTSNLEQVFFRKTNAQPITFHKNHQALLQETTGQTKDRGLCSKVSPS